MQKLSLATLTVLASAACAPGATVVPSTLKLSVAQAELPADGRTATVVTAQLDPAVAGTVVGFSTQLGMFTQSVVPFANGKATATFLPPLEDQLGSADRTELVVTAEVLLQEGNAPLKANTTLVIVPPPAGSAPPSIVLSAPQQNVLADGTTAIMLHVSGRRMSAGDVITLTSDAEVGLPASITLDDTLATDVAIAARTEPVEFTVTAVSDGVPPDSLALSFLSDDAPRYNLDGVFASISYGVVRIEGMGIEPSPQTVAAPTIQMVTIEQSDTEIVAHYETCAVKMPVVCIKLPFQDAQASTTTPSPGFAAAFPITSTPVPVRGKEFGALFQPDDAALAESLVVGADMNGNPDGPLPEDENAPNLVDADNDGAPGLTITNSALGDASHIVLRMKTSKLVGTIVSDDEVDGGELGSLEGTSENAILNGSLISEWFSPTITGQGGNWRMVRVDGATGGINIESNDGQPGISCADVKQYLADPSLVLESPATQACQE